MYELNTSEELVEIKELGTSKEPITSKTVTKRKEYSLNNGEIFVHYDTNKNTLFYLENLPKKKQKNQNLCKLVEC